MYLIDFGIYSYVPNSSVFYPNLGCGILFTSFYLNKTLVSTRFFTYISQQHFWTQTGIMSCVQLVSPSNRSTHTLFQALFTLFCKPLQLINMMMMMMNIEYGENLRTVYRPVPVLVVILGCVTLSLLCKSIRHVTSSQVLPQVLHVFSCSTPP
jgi:hypothetical protein